MVAAVPVVAGVLGADRVAAAVARAVGAADGVAEGGGVAGRAVVVAAGRAVAGVARAVGVAVMGARDAATDVERTAGAKARISSRTWSRSTVWPRS